MLKGQCLCGAVQYDYHGEIEQSILCFCKDCKMAQGTIMAWNAVIETDLFELITGQQLLKEYFHTPNKARVFCSQCASPLYSYRLDLPGVKRLRLGSVNEGCVPRPVEFFYEVDQPDFIEVISPK